MDYGPSGIAGLDGHFGGGIPRGTTVVVISEPDNQLPVFCEQFAGGGVNGGEQLVYFELDRPATDLRRQIASHAVNAEGARKATLKLYDGYAPQFSRGPREGDRAGSFTTPLHRAELFPTILREIQGSQAAGLRLIVESLSSVTNERNEAEVVDFIRSLSFLAWETKSLVLLSLVKGLHSPSFETQIRHAAGGVFELGVERRSFGLYPFLHVAKLLHVRDPVRIFPIKEGDRGLTVETAKRL